MELFGPNFENYREQEKEAPVPAANVENPPTNVKKAKKGKIQAKSTNHKYQFEIMESIGVPREDIKKFADPYYWLTYFPPITIVGPYVTSLCALD